MVDHTSILIHFLHTKTTGSERYTGLPKVTEISGRVAVRTDLWLPGVADCMTFF